MRNEIFTYNNNPVTFQMGNGDLMANATEMAKPFGKNASHWLRNHSTQEFLTELSALRNRNPTDLVQVVNGGSDFGTWMHEDVALEFARWLSPAFAIWCNDRIKELLKHGFTATPDTIEQPIANPDTLIQLATQLKAERAEKERLRVQNQLNEQQIQLAQPKVEYYEKVLQSDSLIATNVIADQLGISAKRLNEILKSKKVIYKQNDTYVLYSDHRGKGYEGYRTHTYTSSSTGQQMTKQHLYWTEKGREFINKIID